MGFTPRKDRLAKRVTLYDDAYRRKPQREAWRAIFDHDWFEADGDPAAHLPEARKGVLGALTPRLAQSIRAYLRHAFK